MLTVRSPTPYCLPPIAYCLRLLVLASILACSATVGSAPDLAQRRIEQLASPYVWSAVAWEARYLPAAAKLVLGQAGWLDEEYLGEEVRAYLEDGRGGAARQGLDHPLLLASAVAAQLRRSDAPTMAGMVFPPVTLALAEPPRFLAVSPREKINLSHWAILDGRMPPHAAEELETGVERLNLSALVIDAVALSAYPPLIPLDIPPEVVFQTIAHEWAHVALFASPLGRAYGASPEARAINETAADMVGEEIASEIARWAGVGLRAARARAGDPAFREALRRARVRADQLLAVGDVAGAEAYLEKERQALVARGYRIRRLNQAYFAFHGNYLDGPAASTEIPDGLEELRRQSRSMGDFLARVGQITSLQDLQRAIR